MDVVVAFGATFVGVLARMFLPYLRKKRQDPTQKFRIAYLATVALGLIIVMLVYPSLSPIVINDFQSGISAFAVAFGVGFGWPSIIDEVGKWSGAIKP